jgi:hypothetical protein
MEDKLGTPGTSRVVEGHGHYHETYEKFEGEWRIASTRPTRLIKVAPGHTSPRKVSNRS